MKRIVLIDGENLLYGLRTLAGTVETPVAREQLVNFPFRSLIHEVIGGDNSLPIAYYGARLRQYDWDEDLLKITKQAVKFQLRLVNTLMKQKISFVKVGYLRAREVDACKNCGHQEWKLLEKGVDVGLAVRMLAEAKRGVEIVLISSDTDLLPAVQAARKAGAEVMFVAYENRPILSLIKEASNHRIITAEMVKSYLTEAKHG